MHLLFHLHSISIHGLFPRALYTDIMCGRMTEKCWTWKNLARSFLEEPRKTTKTSVMVVGAPAKIRTEHLLNTSL
jgi:hypothetical protein